MLYVAHVGWVSCLLLFLLGLLFFPFHFLFPQPFSSFCSISLFLHTHWRESNQESLISCFGSFGIAQQRWPAYYPLPRLYPAEISVGQASFDSLLNNNSIINCASGLSIIHYSPRFAEKAKHSPVNPSIWAFSYSYVLSSACTTTSAPERLHNNTGSKTSSSTTVPTDQKATFTSLSSPPRPSPTSLLRPQNKATMATVTETVSLPNVGVFTDPEHKLWVAESVPTLESVKKGQDLKHGEVTIGIKSTGICGYTASPSILCTFQVLPAEHFPFYKQIRHPLLARRPHRPYDRDRHPYPRPRICRRHSRHAPLSHAPQARRPCRHRTRYHLWPLRTLPHGPLQRLLEHAIPFHASRRRSSTPICQSSGCLVPQDWRHELREWSVA